MYEINDPEGKMEQLTSTIIYENMLSQVDSEGHHYQLLTEVTDRKKYCSAITKVNGFTKYSNGNLHQNRTICGWKILVEWKAIPVYRYSLKELKKNNLV